jgi:hypothetical protein
MLGCLIAAAPEPSPNSEVKAMPPDQAVSILGRQVQDVDGKEIGRLVDVLVDGAGVPQAAVIDFGGFLGVGNRRVAVHWSTLLFTPSDPKRPVTVEMTPDQLKAAPQYADQKPAQVVTPIVPPQPAAVLQGAATPDATVPADAGPPNDGTIKPN